MLEPDLAVEYVLARAYMLRLRRERGKYRCEGATKSGIGFTGEFEPGTQPCWAEEGLPRDDWCPSCRAKQPYHEALVLAQTRCQSLWMRLRRQIDKGMLAMLATEPGP